MHQPSVLAGLRSLQRIMYMQGGTLPDFMLPSSCLVPYDVSEGRILQHTYTRPKHSVRGASEALWRKRRDGEVIVTPQEAVWWFNSIDFRADIGWLRMRVDGPLDTGTCNALLDFAHDQLADVRNVGVILLYGDRTPRETIPAKLRRYVYPIAPRTEGLPAADIGDPETAPPEALRAHWLEATHQLSIEVPEARHPEIDTVYAGLGPHEIDSIIAHIIIQEKGPAPHHHRDKPVLDQLLDPALVAEYHTLWDRAP